MTVTRDVTRYSHRERRQTFDRYTEPILRNNFKYSTSLRAATTDSETS